MAQITGIIRILAFLIATGVILFLAGSAVWTFWERQEYGNAVVVMVMVVAAYAVFTFVRFRARRR